MRRLGALGAFRCKHWHVGLPEGTVTFLFTDIEGSTALLRDHGDGYADILGEHRRLLRCAFAEHGGTEVETQGDAFFVAFPRRVRRWPRLEVHSRRWFRDRVKVRMGIHTGEALVSEEGYVGMSVHRAARSPVPRTGDRCWCPKLFTSSSGVSTFTIWGASAEGSRRTGAALSARRGDVPAASFARCRANEFAGATDEVHRADTRACGDAGVAARGRCAAVDTGRPRRRGEDAACVATGCREPDRLFGRCVVRAHPSTCAKAIGSVTASPKPCRSRAFTRSTRSCAAASCCWSSTTWNKSPTQAARSVRCSPVRPT